MFVTCDSEKFWSFCQEKMFLNSHSSPSHSHEIKFLFQNIFQQNTLDVNNCKNVFVLEPIILRRPVDTYFSALICNESHCKIFNLFTTSNLKCVLLKNQEEERPE